MKRNRIVSGIAVFAILCSVLNFAPAKTEAAMKTVYVTKGENAQISVKKTTKRTKWKSSKKSVVKNTATKNAVVVKGMKKGSTVIQTKIGKKTVQYKIVVETPKISRNSMTLSVGKTAVVRLAGTKRAVNWKSTATRIATVSKSGKIVAKKKGTVYIYAKVGKKKYLCKVTVKENQKQASTKPEDNKPSKDDTEENPKEEPINRTDDIMTTMKVKNGDCYVHCDVYMPAATKKCPAIIMSHGYNGWGKDFQNECKFFQKYGYIAISIDFCGGTGEDRCRSTGRKSTEMTLFTEKSDLLAVFDYVRKMKEVDEENVFLFGGSQGGMVTALAAEERADVVRGVGLYFPAFCIPDNWRSNYPKESMIPDVTDFWGLKLGKEFFVSMRDLYTFDVIGQNYQGPVHIVHGDQDNIAPLSYSQKAVNENYKNATLTVLQGEGHGFSGKGNMTAMDEILCFMEDYLK